MSKKNYHVLLLLQIFLLSWRNSICAIFRPLSFFSFLLAPLFSPSFPRAISPCSVWWNTRPSHRLERRGEAPAREDSGRDPSVESVVGSAAPRAGVSLARLAMSTYTRSRRHPRAWFPAPLSLPFVLWLILCRASWKCGNRLYVVVRDNRTLRFYDQGKLYNGKCHRMKIKIKQINPQNIVFIVQQSWIVLKRKKTKLKNRIKFKKQNRNVNTHCKFYHFPEVMANNEYNLVIRNGTEREREFSIKI